MFMSLRTCQNIRVNNTRVQSRRFVLELKNMNDFLIIWASLIFFSAANGQIVQYACRFRNFSVESETNSAYLVSSNIYQDKHEHKLAAKVNFTKDIHFKMIEVVMHRCSYEKSDCENFQGWKFTRNLRSVVYMKNQIWTSILDHVTPKLGVPYLKKNIYQSKEMSIDANVAVRFYPEVINYFWRADVILHDFNDKKALVLKFEVAFISYVKRDKTRDRGNTSLRTTKVE